MGRSEPPQCEPPACPRPSQAHLATLKVRDQAEVPSGSGVQTVRKGIS